MPVGISCKALLYRRCVPSIESVDIFNGTPIYNDQGDTLRLPRTAKPSSHMSPQANIQRATGRSPALSESE